MKKLFTGITGLGLGLGLSAALFVSAVQAHDHEGEHQHYGMPENVILVIADGMGFPYLSAYRYFNHGTDYTFDSDVERTIFDRYLVGAASTYPADDTWVVDSAASATTLATGVKTYNGAIGVDNNREPLQGLMHYARENGFLTGTVATTRVTHATPAAFFTHAESRRMEDEIADQYATLQDDGRYLWDLVVGSGKQHFVREDEDIDYLQDFRNNNVTVVESLEGLKQADSLPLMGLFYDDSFPYVIDDRPRLREMSREALRLFDQTEQNYAVMIEASMIDWCGHARDIACAMHEMKELDKLMQFLHTYSQENPETLVVLTADHSTGGLTLGADGDYKFLAGEIHKITRGLRTLAGDLQDIEWENWFEHIESHIPFPVSYAHKAELEALALASDYNSRAVQSVLTDIVRAHTGAGFTTSGHTGEDVPVIAFGKGAEYFRGHQDQMDIGKRLIHFVEKR